MRTLSSGLQSHLDGEVTTLATCWKVSTNDSPQIVLGFTDHDTDLVIDGITYESATGYSATAIQNSIELNVDNLDIQGILDSDSISEADLIAGLYDYAEVEIFLVDYTSSPYETLTLRKGWLGEVTIHDNHFVAEIRGLSQILQQNIGELYSVKCRADLGDSRCGIALAGSPSFTVTGTVTSVTDRANFSDSSRAEAADYFNGGLLTWTSGDNEGYSMEVKDFPQGSPQGDFQLLQKMPYTIQVGDTFSVYAGCDKTLATCKAKFDNVVNFRGEPYIPGVDEVTKFGGQS